MVTHVVLFTLNEGVDEGAVEAVWAAIVGLRETISGIEEIVWGANSNPEGLGQGYEVGFVMTFVDAAARDAYLAHPAHEAVHPLIDAVAANVLVFDIAS
jgi:hypothetical protein